MRSELQRHLPFTSQATPAEKHPVLKKMIAPEDSGPNSNRTDCSQHPVVIRITK